LARWATAERGADSGQTFLLDKKIDFFADGRFFIEVSITGVFAESMEGLPGQLLFFLSFQCHALEKSP
jgi:hypothetical protein